MAAVSYSRHEREALEERCSDAAYSRFSDEGMLFADDEIEERVWEQIAEPIHNPIIEVLRKQLKQNAI